LTADQLPRLDGSGDNTFSYLEDTAEGVSLDRIRQIKEKGLRRLQIGKA